MRKKIAISLVMMGLLVGVVVAVVVLVMTTPMVDHANKPNDNFMRAMRNLSTMDADLAPDSSYNYTISYSNNPNQTDNITVDVGTYDNDICDAQFMNNDNGKCVYL